MKISFKIVRILLLGCTFSSYGQSSTLASEQDKMLEEMFPEVTSDFINILKRVTRDLRNNEGIAQDLRNKEVEILGGPKQIYVVTNPDGSLNMDVFNDVQLLYLTKGSNEAQQYADSWFQAFLSKPAQTIDECHCAVMLAHAMGKKLNGNAQIKYYGDAIRFFEMRFEAQKVAKINPTTHEYLHFADFLYRAWKVDDIHKNTYFSKAKNCLELAFEQAPNENDKREISDYYKKFWAQLNNK